jgi:hypothetical protein
MSVIGFSAFVSASINELYYIYGAYYYIINSFYWSVLEDKARNSF